MTARITIEPLHSEDREGWNILWQGYNAFYGRQGKTALDPAITDSTWKRLLDPAEPVFALLARDGVAIVGLVQYIYHRSTIMIGHTCYLQDLFVSAEHRGQGIARALIEAVSSKAREHGAERVYWLTHQENATARRLYDTVAENSGFIVYRKPL